MCIVFGLDSALAIALFHQHENQLQAALANGSQSPLSLEENKVNLLWLACLWLHGLQVLIEQRHATDIHTYLTNGTATRIAIQMSGYLCKLGRVCGQKLCHDCNCSQSLSLLLESGSFINFPLTATLEPCSLRATHLLFCHIKAWRVALVELARPELSLSEQAELGLDADSVLDYHAQTVLEVLHSRGINAHERLGLLPDDHRLASSRG